MHDYESKLLELKSTEHFPATRPASKQHTTTTHTQRGDQKWKETTNYNTQPMDSFYPLGLFDNKWIGDVYTTAIIR